MEALIEGEEACVVKIFTTFLFHLSNVFHFTMQLSLAQQLQELSPS